MTFLTQSRSGPYVRAAMYSSGRSKRLTGVLIGPARPAALVVDHRETWQMARERPGYAVGHDPIEACHGVWNRHRRAVPPGPARSPVTFPIRCRLASIPRSIGSPCGPLVVR